MDANKEWALTEQMMNPFVLCKADGIYDVDNNVSITNNAMIDGGTYFGTTMSTRNIILTIKDIEGHDSNRELVDLIFTKNKPGILQVQDGTHLRAIEYYVESITTTATPKTRLTTISLLCPDPFFYDPTDTSVYIATLISDFEFEHEFDEYGEELGHFNESKIGTIENESADDNIGMTIIIEALGEVINPKLTMIETQEYIAVGTDARPYTMNYKDTITISTVSGKKNVYDADGNSINAYLDEDSTFFQLHRGENSIGYTASTGDDYMAITVMYRYKYLRA